MSEIHEGCGGQIVNRKCSKCGKEWNRLKYFLAKDIGAEAPKTHEEIRNAKEREYKQRIRRGEDIYK